MSFLLRPLIAAIALAVACLFASGCSGGGASTAMTGAQETGTQETGGQETQAQVARAAIGDLRSAPGFTMSGDVTGQNGTTIRLSLRYRRRAGCEGTLTEGPEGGFALVVIGRTAWVKPDATFWRTHGGTTVGRDASASFLRGKFLEGSADGGVLAQLAALCDVSTLTSRVDLPTDVSRRPVTTIAGQRAIPLTSKSGDVTMYVTDTAAPRVLRLVNTTPGASGRVSFSYGTPVALTAPPADGTVSAARYGF